MQKRLTEMLKKSFLLGSIVLSVLFCSESFGLQTKTIDDNGSANVTVSTTGLTRIAVQNDRIAHVRGVNGAYTYENDNDQGAVFIQPTPAYQKKQFILFISTEQGHNYVLHVTPSPVTADTIFLKPVGVINPQAKQWETSSPYTDVLTQLVNDMANHKSPEGYSVTPVSGKTQYLGNVATLRLQNVYSGAHLQGLIYSIRNRIEQPVTVTESEFYQAGDRAIAIENLTIPPKGTTWLYKVRSNG